MSPDHSRMAPDESLTTAAETSGNLATTSKFFMALVLFPSARSGANGAFTAWSPF